MAELGITQKELAEKIGINMSTLSAKINGKRQFTVEEVFKIFEVLEVDNYEGYFFKK